MFVSLDPSAVENGTLKLKITHNSNGYSLLKLKITHNSNGYRPLRLLVCKALTLGKAQCT